MVGKAGNVGFGSGATIAVGKVGMEGKGGTVALGKGGKTGNVSAAGGGVVAKRWRAARLIFMLGNSTAMKNATIKL